ncbi:MAG: RidA family protein [Rubritepida sp.]|jgi:enamine deaminase RidA (YjgF/YER057c/UK114 family)|nr:RidA family protein [Rubritepida sp.]MCU0944048.1 RidA family protein [Rubritepida sp.]
MKRLLCALALLAGPAHAQNVTILNPPGAITATGPWGLAAQAGNTLYVAGMRGIDPATNQLVAGEEARIRQAYRNMLHIAASAGAGPRDAVRLVVYVTDMFRYRPIANRIQEEIWGQGPHPPRTIVEVQRLNQDDIFEVEGTFVLPGR